MDTRYNLNLVLYSLEHRHVHSEIRDSHLGDNLNYLLNNLDPLDMLRLGEAMRHLHHSITMRDLDDKHFEIGHYIQSLRAIGPIAPDVFGVVISISPHLQGLFLLDGERLLESPFDPADVRTIFGTYVV